MGNRNKNDKGCRCDNYTDLRWTYGIKMIILPMIAFATMLQSVGESKGLNFDALLLGALLYLIGICFDFFVSAKSNYGPVLKVRKFCSGALFCVVVVTISLIILIIAMKEETEAVLVSFQISESEISRIIYIIMIGAGFTDPLIELINNIPEND